jgi:hypothetical protein
MTKISYYEVKTEKGIKLLYGCNINEIIKVCKRLLIDYKDIKEMESIQVREKYNTKAMKEARRISKTNWNHKEETRDKIFKKKLMAL